MVFPFDDGAGEALEALCLAQSAFRGPVRGAVRRLPFEWEKGGEEEGIELFNDGTAERRMGTAEQWRGGLKHSLGVAGLFNGLTTLPGVLRGFTLDAFLSCSLKEPITFWPRFSDAARALCCARGIQGSLVEFLICAQGHPVANADFGGFSSDYLAPPISVIRGFFPKVLVKSLEIIIPS